MTPDVGDEIRHVGQSALAFRPSRTTLAWAITPGSMKGVIDRPATPVAAPLPVTPKASHSLQDLFSPSDKPKAPPPSLRELFKT
jgi:hypothetical protein